MELRFDFDVNKAYVFNDETGQRIYLQSGNKILIENQIKRIEFDIEQNEYVFADGELVKDWTFTECEVL